MPLLGSRGAGSARGFGFAGGGNPFIEATGGTITESGDYRIHTFTGPGTFTVTNAGKPSGSDTVDYLVVAGGGGGGSQNQGTGGGGAGGYRESKNACAPWTASPLATPTSLPVSATSYPITIGAGGAWSANGSNTIFSSITSTGGGRGGNNDNGAQPGGSGGGGAGSGDIYGPGVSPPAVPIGTGNTPPVSPPQGNTGGRGAGRPGWTHNGGGGGGATAIGGTANEPTGGPGGAGAGTAINTSVGTPGPDGALKYFGGGGGGSHITGPQPGASGTGGVGGGGRGALNQPPGPATALAGTANTGGGGGGAGDAAIASNSAGGSGIVVIRYKYQ
jgi:hypothetical protein